MVQECAARVLLIVVIAAAAVGPAASVPPIPPPPNDDAHCDTLTHGVTMFSRHLPHEDIFRVMGNWHPIDLVAHIPIHQTVLKTCTPPGVKVRVCHSEGEKHVDIKVNSKEIVVTRDKDSNSGPMPVLVNVSFYCPLIRSPLGHRK